MLEHCLAFTICKWLTPSSTGVVGRKEVRWVETGWAKERGKLVLEEGLKGALMQVADTHMALGLDHTGLRRLMARRSHKLPVNSG